MKSTSQHIQLNQINELVNQALFAYAELVGLTPDSQSWGDKQLVNALNESRDLDSSGLTTFMYLRGLMDHYIQKTQFSAQRILTDWDRLQLEVGKIREVYQMVENQNVVQLIQDFQDSLLELAIRFNVKDMVSYQDLLNDKKDLAMVRRDALRSMEQLQEFQFIQGKMKATELKLNKYVYEFWNINSLLSALRDQKIEGISVCLLRDPREVMASYFVFAIKNGETITILTDREEGPHPAFYRMTAARGTAGRHLSNRSTRNWFPYHLLQLDYDEKGRATRAQNRSDLVPYNTEAVKLKPLGELTPEEIIWTWLVSELISNKYGKGQHRASELAYTGEMVVVPNVLVDLEGSLVKTGEYKPLTVERLKNKDITSDTTAPQWKHKSTRINEWMIEKYGDQVHEEVLNPVGELEQKLLTDQYTKELIKSNEKDWSVFNGKRKVEIESLNPVTFGNREKLEKDRLWVARTNQCKIIQELAKQDFKKYKTEIKEWCQDRIEKNRDFLLEACARQELILPQYKWDSEINRDFNNDKIVISTSQNALVQWIDNRQSNLSWHWDPYGGLSLGKCMGIKYRCAYMHPTVATVFNTIQPSGPESLAIIFGVKKEELPEWLQNWYNTQPYYGNPNLNRLDPSDWVLKNPWFNLNLKVHISLCKNAIHSLRKDLGLPRIELIDESVNE